MTFSEAYNKLYPRESENPNVPNETEPMVPLGETEPKNEPKIEPKEGNE